MKTIINKSGCNINGLERDKKEALHTYELYGKNMDMKEIIWRGWQMDLRQYLDKQCDRKVIWIIGENGNEGKSFFQSNVREEFGYSRVSTLELSENSRNTFHILGKVCSTNTDIFLFNLPRSKYLSSEQYEILESIKDGFALDGKFNSPILYFKKPNVLIVFSNREPNREELSKDRWIILKISEDLRELTEITDGRSGAKKKKKMVNERDAESEDSGECGERTDDDWL